MVLQMRFCSFAGVMPRMFRVPMSNVRVVSRLFVISCFTVFCCFRVVT